MSIMDLNLTRRKSGIGGIGGGGQHPAAAAASASAATAVPISTHTGGGQSYELIKSTQVIPEFNYF